MTNLSYICGTTCGFAHFKMASTQTEAFDQIEVYKKSDCPTHTRLRIWCFTFNNYTEKDFEAYCKLVSDGKLRWIAFAREVASSGTPHLQGIAGFNGPTRKNAVRTILYGSHVAPAYDVKRYLEYIRPDSKGGKSGFYGPANNRHFKQTNLPEDYYEYGVIDYDGSVKGKSRIKDFMRIVSKAETLETTEVWSHPITWQPGYLERAQQFKKLSQSIENENSFYSSSILPSQLYPWQRAALRYIMSLQPDRRSVVTIVEPTGGSGKTAFSSFLASYCGFQSLVPGPSHEIARCLDTHKNKFILDLARDFASEKDFSPYNLIEQIKNCYVTCYKYDNKPFFLKENVLVVVANVNLDTTRLSIDRVRAIKINNLDTIEIYNHKDQVYITPDYTSFNDSDFTLFQRPLCKVEIEDD